MRNVILAGNWKMNETPAQARRLLEQLRESLPKTSHEVVIFPPYLVLEHAAKAGFVKVGAQNCHFEEKGAFTGELSLSMLCEVGAACVLVGHSERRQYFAETDETVRKKIAAALTKGVTPFVCVGETLPQREAGGYLEFVTGQLEAALSG
ncbi:MAG: triosephosphate isomerase, partial [Clostridia bacterium]|nr:triosephosphate isomerase [Clostridia bacterium]